MCLHQTLPEPHNIHDSFSRLRSFWHFTKLLYAYFWLYACIRRMPEHDNRPSFFCNSAHVLSSDISTDCTDNECLSLPLDTKTYVYFCLPLEILHSGFLHLYYTFASGIYPNCKVYPVLNTHLLEIFSLLGTYTPAPSLPPSCVVISWLLWLFLYHKRIVYI